MRLSAATALMVILQLRRAIALNSDYGNPDGYGNFSVYKS